MCVLLAGGDADSDTHTYAAATGSSLTSTTSSGVPSTPLYVYLTEVLRLCTISRSERNVIVSQGGTDDPGSDGRAIQRAAVLPCLHAGAHPRFAYALRKPFPTLQSCGFRSPPRTDWSQAVVRASAGGARRPAELNSVGGQSTAAPTTTTPTTAMTPTTAAAPATSPRKESKDSKDAKKELRAHARLMKPLAKTLGPSMLHGISNKISKEDVRLAGCDWLSVAGNPH